MSEDLPHLIKEIDNQLRRLLRFLEVDAVAGAGMIFKSPQLGINFAYVSP